MIHRPVVFLMLPLAGCMPPVFPAPPGLAQASPASSRAGCALLSRYGASGYGGSAYGGSAYGGGGYGGIGAALGEGVRALQGLSDCPPPGTSASRMAENAGDGAGDTGQDATDAGASIREQLKIPLEQKNRCTEAVRERPEFATVAAHFSNVETGQFSMLQRTDTARPTAEEAREVALYYDASLPCIQTLAAAFARLAPAQAAVLQQSIAAQQNVVTQLATRRLSWGEFAQQSQRISDQAAAKIQTAGL